MFLCSLPRVLLTFFPDMIPAAQLERICLFTTTNVYVLDACMRVMMVATTTHTQRTAVCCPGGGGASSRGKKGGAVKLTAGTTVVRFVGSMISCHDEKLRHQRKRFEAPSSAQSTREAIEGKSAGLSKITSHWVFKIRVSCAVSHVTMTTTMRGFTSPS